MMTVPKVIKPKRISKPDNQRKRPSPEIVRARRAEVARRYRRHRPAPDIDKIIIGRRRNEIEDLIRHRHVTLPDTDDRETYLRFWAWHNLRSPRQEHDLEDLCKRLGATVPATEITATVRYVKRRDLRRFSARTLGKHLRLTDDERLLLGITTIEAFNITRAERRRIRREEKRMKERQRRRANGIRPRAVYLEENRLSRTQPWRTEGISRRTWERRRKAAVTQVRGQHLTSRYGTRRPASTETPSVPHRQQASLPKRSLDMEAVLTAYERMPMEWRAARLCLA
jgi:hypothetical protein